MYRHCLLYTSHHLELTRKEFRVSEIINHMPAFHVVAGIAICTPHCAATVSYTHLFNPQEPLFLLIDYFRVRFPTTDALAIIRDVLQLKSCLLYTSRCV